MNESLSIWSLISNASLLVQLVMLVLMSASIISWIMIFQRFRVLQAARKAVAVFEEQFWSGGDLGQLYVQTGKTPDPDSGMEMIFRAGFKEFGRVTQGGSKDAEAIMTASQRAMCVALAREQERLGTHLSFLATVGSTSPYIGLFGTVWGIMNSFRGLANVHQATLSVVAPGIAEALIATAMGLFAAIPAVIAYNRYAAQVESLLGSYETFADEFSAILHRRALAS